MSPFKQAAVGLGGCVLAPGRSVYKLKNGTQTNNVAVTVSLLRAEPSLRRLSEAVRINCEEAAAQGYSSFVAMTTPSRWASCESR